ncbi:serine hydrolase [Gordonia phage Yvonnetastic]|uniref:Serine hydrolase n=1 Tax=Gordonia phage Yvonnetastic TaxID=1821566 RepID=A0A142K9C2_9CAUD|nr:serine hydrolase [Gordonia phage Yvonnetastic]AMS02705.1 serine hydrolase [Gordonia phage Yvonnetastic]WKW86140.1 serine hydrolase [Gordonia Phage JonJames]
MKKFNILFAVLVMMSTLVTGLGLSFFTAGEARAACPGAAYFAVGGNGDNRSANVPGIPAGAWVHRVGYPADVLQGDNARRVAMSNLNRAARDLRRACPGARIKVRAYSLGASAASRAVDFWQTEPYMARNTDATYYGNPRRQNHRGYGGIELGLPNLGFYTMWGARHNGPIPILDVCRLGQDAICDSSIPHLRDPGHALRAWQGYFGRGHWY